MSVPHAGTYLPASLRVRLTPAALTLPDTDWFVDRLLGFLPGSVTTLVATHSRIVVDANRGPDGAKLYPGQAETGICPTETFAGVPHYIGPVPDATEIAARLDSVWHPYHATLATELDRLRRLHGRAVLLDVHSIRSVVPRLFTGSLPALNWGTNGGASCTLHRIEAVMQAAGDIFDAVLNGRFRGGYITRHHGRPESQIDAIQLEIAQRTYLEEDKPPAWDPARAASLVGVLRAVTDCLAA